jgi:hypothetical protein
MRRIFFAAVLLSATAAGVWATQSALAQSATTLTAQEIRDQLIGNTISGVEDGESYVEYLRKDGAISGQSGSEKYSGLWRIGDDQICFFYKEDGKSASKSENWDCTFVVIHGDKVIWQGTDDPDATLLAGNPNGL